MRVVTGRERTFGEEELLVSKTDLEGRITYANELFERLAGYPAGSLVGLPHSVVRHPDMPRTVFKLMWDTIQGGRECFAFVKNLARNGDHYWVFAHITPTFDLGKRPVAYHSNRRAPNRLALPTIERLYSALCTEERRHGDKRAAVDAGLRLLEAKLADLGMGYDELMFELDGRRAAA